MSYTKLFNTMILSTIWTAPDHVRIVWVTLLALADMDGVVHASVPGLAKAASVDVESCREAIQHLSEPDPDSRTKEHEGRRIIEVDGGWWLVNYEKYRRMMSKEDQREKNRIRQERWRDRRRNGPVTDCHASNDTQKQTQKQTQTQKQKQKQKQKQGSPPIVPPKGDSVRKKRKGPMPASWCPNGTALAKAREYGLDVFNEEEYFKEWTTAKGVQYVDWDAAFLNHLRSQRDRKSSVRPVGGTRGVDLEEGLFAEAARLRAQEKSHDAS